LVVIPEIRFLLVRVNFAFGRGTASARAKEPGGPTSAPIPADGVIRLPLHEGRLFGGEPCSQEKKPGNK